MNLNYREQAAEGKRWCYDCKYYYTSLSDRYNKSACAIYDLKEIFHDDGADSCTHYTSNGKKPWYEKYYEMKERYDIR